jgi:hypothetical protein
MDFFKWNVNGSRYYKCFFFFEKKKIPLSSTVFAHAAIASKMPAAGGD